MRDPAIEMHSRAAGERVLWLVRGRGMIEPSGAPRHVVQVLRAAAAGMTSAAGGAEALAELKAQSQALVAAAGGHVGYFDALRPDSVKGLFHAGYGVAMNFPAGKLVAEGSSIPATLFVAARKALREQEAAALMVASRELMRFADADALFEILLRQAIANATDLAFCTQLDALAASVTSAGPGVDDIAFDLRRALAAIDSGADAAFHIGLPAAAAKRLAVQLDYNGQRAHPGMSPTGGTLHGMPAHVSAALTTTVLVTDARALLTASGGVTLDTSEAAAIAMDDNPSEKTNDLASPPAPAEGNLVSMFQTNSVAIRARREWDFTPLRSAAAAKIVGAGTLWGLNDTSPPA